MTDAQLNDAATLRLIQAIDRLKRQVGDVIANPDPDEPDYESLDYLINQMMDSAHEILDLAHEFRTAIKAK